MLLSVKENIMPKQYIYLRSFVSGFLYVFGLSENPVVYFKEKYRERNDAEEIAKDWIRIGTDMQKSYEQFKSTGQTT